MSTWGNRSIQLVRSECNSCSWCSAPVPAAQQRRERGTRAAGFGGLQGQHRLSGLELGASAGSVGKVFEHFETLVSLTVVVFSSSDFAVVLTAVTLKKNS